jgi:hypothetical protein
MLSSLGYFAAAGSTVQVPSIIGLSPSTAASTLSSVGLSLGSSTGSTTSGATSGNDGQIASQSISSGTYVAYGTTITYTTYSYVPPCVPSYGSEYISYYGACNDCVKTAYWYKNDLTCGTSPVFVRTSEVDCSYAIPLGPVSEYLIGEDANFCYYQTEYAFENSCTHAITYEMDYWQVAKSTPSQSCFI